jgi:Ca2+-transporting ATPase
MSEPSSQHGLTQAEARERLRVVGPNELPREKRASFLRRLLRQFRNALLYLLLFALGFDLLAWAYEGARGVPVEAIAILAVLLLNAGLGVLQEYRSEHALAELEKLGSPRVWAYRDGVLERIEAREVVPGDLLRLEAGDRVPADGTARHAESLAVDESLLTGESLPVEKGEEGELSSGTSVLRGRAQLLVTRTGPSSAMGRLAGTLSRIESNQTPLERRIDQLGVQVARYVAVLSVLLLLGGLASEGLARFSAVVMYAVAFGVAVVPESMPAMMTLALAFGVQRMARKNAVVRRLAAVEALGSVTVIASDKTGTLTSNKLVVDSLFSENENDALLAMALANDAERHGNAGDPLERALVDFAAARGADVEALRFANPRVSSRPFDSRWKYMRATVVAPNGERQSYVKGAAEIVLERSRLDPAARRKWLGRAEAEAKRGFKVLGLATGKDDQESELSFLGVVTLWDAPRPEAKQAVRAAEAAGVRVLMLTGDHPETARAIGEHVGVVSERSLSGTDLDAMSQAQLQAALSSVRLFCRMLPEHKLRIVEALQARGEIVAVTGDGLNDAPALKRADVGVAMGQRGSEVTREVADIVLLDDHFLTIVTAIEEGRVIYENIMNFIRFTFSSNVALMLIVLGSGIGSLVLGLRMDDGALLLPLTALQVLWINFLGDGPPALAISVDRSPHVMQKPPRPRGAALLDGPTLRYILIDGGFKGAIGLLLLVLLPLLGVGLPATAASVFLYEAIAKLASAYPARKAGARPATNGWLHLSVASGIALAIACVTFGPLQAVLGLSPLERAAFVPLGCAVLLTVLTSELLARAARGGSTGAGKVQSPFLVKDASRAH